MRRCTLLAFTTLSAMGTLLTACGADGGRDGKADDRPKPIGLPYAEPQVVVDGAPLAGLDPKMFTCQDKPGQRIILSGPDVKDGGLGLTLSVDEPRTLKSFSFKLDGVQYSAADNRPNTKASVTHDGDRYTIEGVAQSWDVEPAVFKPFTASFTCKPIG